MKKFIATTTIFEPSEALKRFSRMPEWKLVVAGDKKTPHDLYKKMENIIYLSPEDQERLYPKLSDLIGWNKIQRRNIAMLHAYKLGADIIALVDDDNIPLENWGQDLLVGKTFECDEYTPETPVFDPLSVTEYKHLWHRGFPLPYIKNKNNFSKTRKTICPDIQADFWNGDPDIDAIARLEHAPECLFSDSYFPFSSSKISPFNSQNTFLTRRVVRDYFVLPFVGRMDDIWASYYTQSKGFRVVYNKASVYQARNEHDLIKDFNGEIIGYQNNHHITNEPENIKKYIPVQTWDAFLEFQREVDTCISPIV